jgi:hypothetical protein
VRRGRFRLTRGEVLGRPECPLMKRWGISTPWGELLLHRHLAPDLDAPHDHPWSFVTFIFRGEYHDVAEDGRRELVRAPAVRRRAATHRHRVEPGPRGAWSLVLAGPPVRPWFLYAAGERLSIGDYLERFGRAPCLTEDQ